MNKTMMKLAAVFLLAGVPPASATLLFNYSVTLDDKNSTIDFGNEVVTGMLEFDTATLGKAYSGKASLMTINFPTGSHILSEMPASWTATSDVVNDKVDWLVKNNAFKISKTEGVTSAFFDAVGKFGAKNTDLCFNTTSTSEICGTGTLASGFTYLGGNGGVTDPAYDYGSGITYTFVGELPEPDTIQLFGIGVLLVAVAGWAKRHRIKSAA